MINLKTDANISFIGELFKETYSTAFTLLKIMLPISIVIKILSELNLIDPLGYLLSPIMGLVGLPGDFGLVWAAGMMNFYGSIPIFIALSKNNVYSVAQVTVLASMILISHALPIEVRIAQKAGVRAWFMASLRIFSALFLGWILNNIFTFFNIYQNGSTILWEQKASDPSLLSWFLNELWNYIIIFLMIFSLLALIKILTKVGVIDKLNNILKPTLKYIGMSENAALLTIIGATLGISYGGGLIIKEAKGNILTKKDIFLSLCFMGLAHGLVEDSLVMTSLGASLIWISIGRIIFTFIVMTIIIRIITRMTTRTFERYFLFKIDIHRTHVKEHNRVSYL